MFLIPNENYIDVKFYDVPDNFTYSLTFSFVEYSKEKSTGLSLLTNSYAPTFEPAEWDSSTSNYVLNCYAYALDIKYGSYFNTNIIIPCSGDDHGSGDPLNPCNDGPLYQIGCFGGTCPESYPSYT